MGDDDTVVHQLRRTLGFARSHRCDDASFARSTDAPGGLRDNRRGAVELFATPRLALAAIVRAADGRVPAADRAWLQSRRARHLERVRKTRQAMRNAPDGADGRLHPNRLLAVLNERLASDAVVVADGGDFLAFARVGIGATTYLDPGALGCIGVGVPFGVAAALACPGRTVAVLTGDGAFGFNALEIDTAVRHRAPLLVVVANNGAWQLEVHDQQHTYGTVVGTRLQYADHARLARAFGAFGERVERGAQLEAAIDRAFAAVRRGQPALLDVLVTTDAVSSDAKSGLAWVPDLQPLAAWDEAERRHRSKSEADTGAC